MTIDLANAAGQHSAAISGIKILGGELFDQFTEKRETLNINLDLGNIRTSAQLQKYLEAEYGPQLTRQLLDHWHKPKMIEHEPDNHAPSADNEALEPITTPEDDDKNGAENSAVGAENRAILFDRDRARKPIGDLDTKTAKRALESLQNSQAPKLK
jgi:hypothetical protein